MRCQSECYNITVIGGASPLTQEPYIDNGGPLSSFSAAAGKPGRFSVDKSGGILPGKNGNLRPAGEREFHPAEHFKTGKPPDKSPTILSPFPFRRNRLKAVLLTRKDGMALRFAKFLFNCFQGKLIF